MEKQAEPQIHLTSPAASFPNRQLSEGSAVVQNGAQGCWDLQAVEADPRGWNFQGRPLLSSEHHAAAPGEGERFTKCLFLPHHSPQPLPLVLL